MADINEKYFPFRSISGDRKYSAEDWAAYFGMFLGNGVFYSSADRLKVVANEGMKVKVNTGAAFVNGRGYRLEADLSYTLDIADGVLNRIDRIVLRCDYTNRLIEIAVKKGSYSTEPTATELTRDADVYELALADIYVAAGVVEITNAAITDQRLNASLCGIVTGLVEQADTTEIFNQFTTYMQEFKRASQTDFESWEEERQQAFEEWFEGIKDILNEDVAANMLEMINTMRAELTDTVPYNLIPFPYYEGSHTDNGIDYVVNEDGSVETNGTSTSDQSSLILCYGTVFPKGTYTISGCPSGGKYYRIRVGVNGGSFICSDNGDGATFTLSEDTSLLITIQVLNATTVENLTFKPMLVKGDTAKEFRKNFKSVYELQQEPFVEISNSNTVTEEGIALDARQANPNIEGTLAAQMATLNTAMDGVQFRVQDGKLQFRYDSEVYS